MKAIVYQKYGTPDNLVLEEVEKPSPEENEVLIKIHATSINSWDWDLLTGTFQGRIGGFSKPKFNILGCDVAGTVEEVGNKVTQFQPGDEVFGDMSGFRSRDWGGFAEFACAREAVLAPKSKRMTFEQAAATPQAGVLALKGLADLGKVKQDGKILINGAGGGGGTFAIQLAKQAGVEITGVDSIGKLDAISSLGCNYVIDYYKEDFTKSGKRYELILDVKSTRSVFDYKRALNPNGIYATVGGNTGSIAQVALLGPLFSGSRKIKIIGHEPSRKDLEHLTELFEEDSVIPVIDKIFDFTQVAEAFRYFGESNFVGKVVITI